MRTSNLYARAIIVGLLLGLAFPGCSDDGNVIYIGCNADDDCTAQGLTCDESLGHCVQCPTDAACGVSSAGGSSGSSAGGGANGGTSSSAGGGSGGSNDGGSSNSGGANGGAAGSTGGNPTGGTGGNPTGGMAGMGAGGVSGGAGTGCGDCEEPLSCQCCDGDVPATCRCSMECESDDDCDDPIVPLGYESCQDQAFCAPQDFCG